jgi:Domain of unknown function (DUF4214)
MKTSSLCTILFAAICLFAWPQRAEAQYCDGGTAYGTSIITYDDASHGVYAYSATELDYCAGLYYDPYVEGYLYQDALSEFLGDAIDSNYGYGYADVYPAEAYTSASAKPQTKYIIKTYHYVVAYYYEYACFSSGCGNYWYDPWGYYFSDGDYGPGYDFFGYYSPGYYVTEYYYLGSTMADIVTPYFCTGVETTDGRYYFEGSSSSGEVCYPPQARQINVHGPHGVPLAMGRAPASGLPYVDSIKLQATLIGFTGGSFTWSVTSGADKVTLTDEHSATVTVHSKKKSDAQNDVMIHLHYSATDGATVDGDYEETVQQPTRMQFDKVTETGANKECSNPKNAEEYLPGSSGWYKDVRWLVVDHLGHKIEVSMPLTSTTNPYAGQGAGKFSGVTAGEMESTNRDGTWEHHYHWCSTICGRGGSERVRAYQRYVVNGFTFPDIQLAYECTKVTVEGDGTDQSPLQPKPNTVAQYTADFWLGALGVDSTDSDRQYWTDTLTSAQYQGTDALLSQARIFARSLFQSADYINRNESDENYVDDLYWAYLRRAPEESGYNFWLSVLKNDEAQGLDGREHLLQAFEGSQEFMNIISSLDAPPQPGCDVNEEQNCYNQGGDWDSSTCSCTYNSDPCWSGRYYICE